MSVGIKRAVFAAVIILVGFSAGRLFLREVMNLLLGGTLFGGNFL